jgi:iron complex outermembrane receptor protein
LKQALFKLWSRVPAASICVLVATTPALLQAQQNGSSVLTGTILDPTGKVVPNAVVVVKDESTGATAGKATADAQGHFSTISVPNGKYTVEVSAPGFATASRKGVQVGGEHAAELSISLSVASLSQEVTVEAESSIASQVAASSGYLDEVAPHSEISQEFIQNFTSPISDYTEEVQMAPGTFSVNPNGVGLGDGKTYFRGFSDGQFTITYDGIPWNDTNSPTHHSWVFFPSQWTGGVDFDRSPGTAATFGPTNFGGSINLKSKEVPSEQQLQASISYGSFNTKLYDVAYDTGNFGGQSKKSSLMFDVHHLMSEGYETFNYQQRDAGSAKYQYKVSPQTVLTFFTGVIDMASNTPNLKGPTRAQVAQYGDNYDNYLLSGDPKSPYYYKYNFYQVPTDFEYFGIKSDLGHGWRLDDKVYTYRYYNKQNYNNSTTSVNATSGVDKLNSYRKVGDTLALTQDSKWGQFRTGLWYEWAYTDRYQVPTNPLTWVDAALPNFHEKFNTNSWQPYAEYQLKATHRLTVTGGVKLAYYNQYLHQFADNGKTVGNLGGLPFVDHSAEYHSWLPSVAANYRLINNWSAYAQFSTGSVIPPSSVFDVKNAALAVLPKPTTTKTYQVGSVLKLRRLTLDADFYYSHFQNPYSTVTDVTTGEPIYVQSGDSVSKGVEAESTIYFGRGVSIYLNGTAGSAKYVTTDLWVANAPKNTVTAGLSYQHRNWDLGFFNKRIGQMYNDNGATNQAVAIDPFDMTNLFLNYTVRNASRFDGTKLRLSVNNLTDSHNIIGVIPASTKTSVASPGDFLTLLPGRSIMMSVTFGWMPKR